MKRNRDRSIPKGGTGQTIGKRVNGKGTERMQQKRSLCQTSATFLVFLSAAAGAGLIPADFRPCGGSRDG